MNCFGGAIHYLAAAEYEEIYRNVLGTKSLPYFISLVYDLVKARYSCYGSASFHFTGRVTLCRIAADLWVCVHD